MNEREDGAMDGVEAGAPEGGELDGLLREWHSRNAARARAGKDRLLAALRDDEARLHGQSAGARATPGSEHRGRLARGGRRGWRAALGGVVLALAAAVLVVPAVWKPSGWTPGSGGTSGAGGGARNPTRGVLDHLATATGTLLGGAPASAASVVMAPEGGRLEAVDGAGAPLGPFVLKQTDVDAEIAGRLARVTLRQTFSNPHPEKIEAVYTFPMSHRSAVDRMRMTIGARVIEGRVKERGEARRTYEAARDSGRVASLLEQERPNIFTQSVANIEPGATVEVEISYVEWLESREGEYEFTFPTVVGPRYIPGSALPVDAAAGDEALPEGFAPRRGLVLLGPASVTAEDGSDAPSSIPSAVELAAAVPVVMPETMTDGDAAPVAAFAVQYADGARERGVMLSDQVGQLGGRWFVVKRSGEPAAGSAFADATDQVPDADRITPMPVRPPERSGQDLTIRVRIDSGDVGLGAVESKLHGIVTADSAFGDDGLPRRTTVALKQATEIPNRDFVLRWRRASERIGGGVLTHSGPQGNFFAVTVEPPARAADAERAAVARELVFVLDTSGSMRGVPIDTAKRVMRETIATMRPADRFNVVTFAGSTAVLWDQPRSGTPERVAEATSFVDRQEGRGGTEMMAAIEAALAVRDAEDMDDAASELQPSVRIVMFMTDGYVGNDQAIIEAIKRHRGTTRVFSFGIGNSVNRFLLDGMARAGGGAAEYVLIGEGATEGDAARAVERFTRRTQTPVLTDISAAFSSELGVLDVLPAAGNVPDVFDVSPVTIVGRYPADGRERRGTMTLRGRTASGAWERVVPMVLPAAEAEGGTHSAVGTLWARAKVDELLWRDLEAVQAGRVDGEVRREIVRLGESFQIMSPYTSFVAVDQVRVTVAGKPRLVPIPIELPDALDWEGFFGGSGREAELAEDIDQLNDRLTLLQLWSDGSSSSEVPEIDLDKLHRQMAGLSGQSPFEDERDRSVVRQRGVDFRTAPGTSALSGESGGLAGAGGAAVGKPASAAVQDRSMKRVIAPQTAQPTTGVPLKTARPSAAGDAGSRENEHQKADLAAGRAVTEPSAAPPPTNSGSAPRDAQAGGGRGRASRDAEMLSKDEEEILEVIAPAVADRADSPSPVPDGAAQAQSALTFVETNFTAAAALEGRGVIVPDELVAAYGARYVVQAAERQEPAAAQTAAELLTERYVENSLLQTTLSTLRGGAAGADANGTQTGGTDTPIAAERLQAVAALAPRVDAELERWRGFVRKVDRRLVALLRERTAGAERQRLNTARQQAQTRGQMVDVGEPNASLEVRGDEVLAAVLLSDAGAAVIEKITAAGMRVESVSATDKVVVGWIAVARLLEVSQVDEVRRIEGVEVGGAK